MVFSELYNTRVVEERLKHFQRLGWTKPGSGTGKHYLYDDVGACKMLLALELQQMGMDPLLIAAVLRKNWLLLWTAVLAAGSVPDMLVVLEPMCMTGAFKRWERCDWVKVSLRRRLRLLIPAFLPTSHLPPDHGCGTGTRA